MATIRQTIVAEIIARLQAIRTADGFETDAGEAVFVGEKLDLGKDDPDAALAIVLEDDEITKFDIGKTSITLPITIQAIVKVGQVNPWLVIESLLGDIKRGIELLVETRVGPAKTLAGYPISRDVTRTLERELGSTTAGVGVTYKLDYSEGWGEP